MLVTGIGGFVMAIRIAKRWPHHLKQYKCMQKMVYQLRLLLIPMLMGLLLNNNVFARPWQTLLDQRVTVTFGNETMDKSLDKLKQATKNIAFNYKLDDVQSIRVRGNTFTNTPLKEILNALMEHAPLTYMEKYGSIIISRKQEAAARITITGIVSDSTGPLAGVTVNGKGTSAGVSTDNSGSYRITVSSGEILVFSHLGYKTQQVVADHSPLPIMLKQEASGLQSVVVVGYGTQKKSDVTGAIETISS